MRKINCWEFKMCGREKESAAGMCPVMAARRGDGINGGINGGRVCWVVAGTCCDGKVQGAYAQKVMTCTACEFRLRVKEEESYKFKPIFF